VPNFPHPYNVGNRMPFFPKLRSPVPLLVVALAVTLTGCPEPESETTSSGTPLAGVELRLLVVDDPAIASAAKQLRGEWETQTRSSPDQAGSNLEVRQMTTEELLGAEQIETDTIICPSCLLGELARRKLAKPLPKELMQSGEKQSDEEEPDEKWSGIFELPKLREVAWADRIQAIPFGSPVFVCYYRRDLLEKLGRKPPGTWAEYQRLAGLLADREVLGDAAPDGDTPWCGTIEPLAPGWAGLVLLARAAPYAKHRDFYSALFDTDTMEPLIAGPPFVRALEELVAVAKLGPADALKQDPATARAAFWQGRCGMALTWPTTTAEIDKAPDAIEVGFAELPGSEHVYHIGKKAWETRADDAVGHVPLLGIAGRLGVVSDKSQHPETAFHLLFWLSGRKFGTDVCSVSPATTLFRRSQMKDLPSWVEKPISVAPAEEYAELTQETFRRQQWVFALRIPGRSEYLAALDEAVAAAVRGEKSPADALQDAADRWRQITERLGTEPQKAAYLQSLGL